MMSEIGTTVKEGLWLSVIIGIISVVIFVISGIKFLIAGTYETLKIISMIAFLITGIYNLFMSVRIFLVVKFLRESDLS
jgi:hypothetical protein